jgi:CHAT domain-containing protein/uncharacterized protein HemY
LRIRYFNIVILLFITFISGAKTYAQETNNIFDYWLEEYNTGIGFINQEDFNNAIPHFENAYKVIDQIDFNTNAETKYYPVDNANYLGICYFRLNQFKDAEIYFKSALELISLIENPNKELFQQIEENILSVSNQLNDGLTIEERIVFVKNLEETEGKDNLNYAQQLFKLAFHFKNVENEIEFHNQLIEVERILKLLGETNGDYYAYAAYYLGNFYFDLKDYNKAAEFLHDAIRLKSFIENDDDVLMIFAYSSYGLSLYNLNDFKNAIPPLEKTLEDETYNTLEFLEFNTLIANLLSISYGRLGQNQLAKATINKMLTNAASLSSKKGPIYDKALLYTGSYHINESEHDNAFIYLKEAENNCISRDELKTSLYSALLSKLGIYNTYKSNFKKAEEQFKKALKIELELNDGKSPEYAANLNSIANLYLETGDFVTSKKYYKDALIKLDQFYNKSDITYQDYLISYSNLLIVEESYDEAELILKKALQIYTAKVQKSDLKFVNLILNIARVYNFKKDYKNALKNYYEAIAILEADDNSDNYTYGTAITNLSGVYKDLGDYENAIKLLLKSFTYTKNNLGVNNSTYGSIAQNLGQTYAIINDYENAKTYYDIALKNLENTVSSDHYYYGILASNMSHLLMKTGNIEKAEELANLSLENIEQNYGANSSMYVSVQVMQPLLLMHKKKYREAIKVFASMKPKIESVFGKDNQFYMNVIMSEGMCNELIGNYDKALQLYKAFYNGFFKELEHVFTYRSEEEKRKFLLGFKGLTAWYNSLALNPNFNSEDIITSSLNKHLVTKGLLINSSKEMITELLSLNIDKINNDIKAFKLSKTNLTKATNQIKKSDSLKAISNSLELKLIKHYDKHFKVNPNFNKDWTKIKSHLKFDEIAIDYSIYKPRKDEDTLRESVYIAYLIHKDWEQPKVVELFKEGNLKAILKNQNPNTLYQTRGSKAKSATNTKGLYDLIWSPIEQHLEGIETIYFSPSGLLNQIPFAAIDTEDKPILAEQYNLVQLSSTYALTKDRIQPIANNTLFIGGINYEYTSSALTTASQENISELSMLKSLSGTRSIGTKWNYLPGTLKEIKTLESLFLKKNNTYSLMSANEATETSFKNLSGDSPNIIHIATHGFFFENPKTKPQDALNINQENIYTVAEDPLVRSGLIFSGANYAWQNGNNPYTVDNGILTALEISNLDLSNTDLVVLSACETGLGDIDGSEGVYGLQRAFKIAGVDLIMMSLWEVPDAETSEFMTIFYTNWLSGQEVRSAFRNTQLKMSETYKDNPEKWAAFVLFE